MALLEVRGVQVSFPGPGGGRVQAVRGVSFALEQGEILGLVGESGCGKSTLARALAALVPVSAGDVLFDGLSIPSLRGRALRRLRPDIQMVFQDPYASLDPRMTVMATLAEALRVRSALHGEGLRGRVEALMDEVGLAAEFTRKYPHEFSGGQRQRIAIARALAAGPRILLADEPVSALDVSIQSQIINLLGRLCRRHELTMLFISHDLAVVHHIADRIAVMYLGRILEMGPAERVLDEPLHPYTRALVSAIPEPDPERERLRRRILLRGDPPSPFAPPPGCPFHTRCPWAEPDCARQCPELDPAPEPGRTVACLRLDHIA
ncbi:MAG: ATP-binding cassette domain-containing protein [Lentisphaeria bacterium]|nr:ATP-binding cassette domain-containing protein [Lentisphaeria bacterium]